MLPIRRSALGVQLLARHFSAVATRKKGATLELVCYPYLRDQLKTADRRGWVSTIFARLSLDGAEGSSQALSKSKLSNKFVDFKDFQELYSSLCQAQSSRPSLSNIEIYFAPPANGRPAQFFDQLVQYDSDEYKQLVVPEMRGVPGDLFRLPSLPSPVQENLLQYLSHSDVISQGKKELKGVRFLNFLFSGSPDYNFTNWQSENSRQLQPGATLDGTAGWRVLDSLKLHDTIFLQEAENIHCGIYLGGRLVLHKLSSKGPLWISTFRELLELTGRWDTIHVRSGFKPEKLAEYNPNAQPSPTSK